MGSEELVVGFYNVGGVASSEPVAHETLHMQALIISSFSTA